MNHTRLSSIAGYLTFCCLMLMTLARAEAQRDYPPDIKCDQVFVYKHASGSDLKLWIFNPPGHNRESESPAIVFFFGGGWRKGSPSQFVRHCEYLASRGMVSMVADYRVASRHGVVARDCVADAKSAVRWIREHASELGVDPNRIASGGGSAGGHLAAATAILPGFEEEDENGDIRSDPNSLVLFNPALIMAPAGSDDTWSKEKLESMKKRMGIGLEAISPYHHVRQDLPPTIIFHGTADKTVPYETAEIFTRRMKELGNSCTLVGYKDVGHGFFNYGRSNNGPFISTLNCLDQFLVELGWIVPPPAIVGH